MTQQSADTNRQPQEVKVPYTRPELVTHQPLRDITAFGSYNEVNQSTEFNDCPSQAACEHANQHASFL